MCGIAALQAVLGLPALVWPHWLDNALGLTVVAPFFVPYVLHLAGVPGMLSNDGACGWGWCAPTVLGWSAAVAGWLLGLYLLARVLVRLFPGRTPDDQVPDPGSES